MVTHALLNAERRGTAITGVMPSILHQMFLE
ncbi:hypothetical protein Ocin01_01593 [Orchesella cincta]|uniref:Uncharacterized protein n=1 Tax=Orchesella cincta TaxID=48709 RepID=A0A1D2NJ01_ORCCI|nr:hypothetical protein Ocin01_01593 [Orchesella cincta]